MGGYVIGIGLGDDIRDIRDKWVQEKLAAIEKITSRPFTTEFTAAEKGWAGMLEIKFSALANPKEAEDIKNGIMKSGMHITMCGPLRETKTEDVVRTR